MLRTISTLDLNSGALSDRASNTPTLDVPPDFDRATPSAQLDLQSHLHYSTFGRESVRPVFVRPLSWRTRGEECLVQQEGGSAKSLSKFFLCAVERHPLATLGELHARRGGAAAEVEPAAKPAKKPRAPRAARSEK